MGTKQYQYAYTIFRLTQLSYSAARIPRFLFRSEARNVSVQIHFMSEVTGGIVKHDVAARQWPM